MISDHILPELDDNVQCTELRLKHGMKIIGIIIIIIIIIIIVHSNFNSKI